MDHNIPKIVLDLYDYRANIYAKSDNITTSDDLPTFDTIRQRTEFIFNWLYETHGYKKFIDTAKKMKKLEGLEGDDFITAKGLIAELVLLCSINEWIKQTGTNEWRVVRELYVPHRNGTGITEIDIILYSVYSIIVFEVKSYSGVKTLTDICTINTKRSYDLFSQNGLHIESLYKQLTHLNTSTIGAFKSAYFNFSHGDVVDNRTVRNKQLIPVIDETNIFSFLESMRRNCVHITWDRKIHEKISDLRTSGITREQHMKQFENNENEEVDNHGEENNNI